MPTHATPAQPIRRMSLRIQIGESLMAGSDDPLVPPVNARILSLCIPNNRLHIVAGGGHLFMLHRLDEVGTVIREFLDAPDAATAVAGAISPA